MSSRYRILRKPFQQASPSPDMRKQVKKELCGSTDGFVMMQTSMRYQGNPPTNSASSDLTLQEEDKLCNPSTCHSYIIDYFTSDYTYEAVRYELVVTYDTPSGFREEVVKLRPDQEYAACPTLLVTFYPYNINNPNDNSQYSYHFSTTNLQWVVTGRSSNGNFSYDDSRSPTASAGRWIIYPGSNNDAMTPYELCLGQSYVFSKHYSDFSFHIRTVIERGTTSSLSTVYSNVMHILPVYMNSHCGSSVPVFQEVRERTLPPPYS